MFKLYTERKGHITAGTLLTFGAAMAAAMTVHSNYSTNQQKFTQPAPIVEESPIESKLVGHRIPTFTGNMASDMLVTPPSIGETRAILPMPAGGSVVNNRVMYEPNLVAGDRMMIFDPSLPANPENYDVVDAVLMNGNTVIQNLRLKPGERAIFDYNAETREAHENGSLKVKILGVDRILNEITASYTATVANGTNQAASQAKASEEPTYSATQSSAPSEEQTTIETGSIKFPAYFTLRQVVLNAAAQGITSVKPEHVAPSFTVAGKEIMNIFPLTKAYMENDIAGVCEYLKENDTLSPTAPCGRAEVIEEIDKLAEPVCEALSDTYSTAFTDLPCDRELTDDTNIEYKLEYKDADKRSFNSLNIHSTPLVEDRFEKHAKKYNILDLSEEAKYVQPEQSITEKLGSKFSSFYQRAKQATAAAAKQVKNAATETATYTKETTRTMKEAALPGTTTYQTLDLNNQSTESALGEGIERHLDELSILKPREKPGSLKTLFSYA